MAAAKLSVRLLGEYKDCNSEATHSMLFVADNGGGNDKEKGDKGKTSHREKPKVSNWLG
jgi:hypothetical protein